MSTEKERITHEIAIQMMSACIADETLTPEGAYQLYERCLEHAKEKQKPKTAKPTYIPQLRVNTRPKKEF